MTTRPPFLSSNGSKNARSLLAAFLALPEAEAAEVDKWLLQAIHYGSVSSSELYLYNWINEQAECEY